MFGLSILSYETEGGGKIIGRRRGCGSFLGGGRRGRGGGGGEVKGDKVDIETGGMKADGRGEVVVVVRVSGFTGV